MRDRDLVLANLAQLRARIERACERSGRDPASVRLVAAAKTVEAEVIGWVRDAGVREVGENYVSELRAKREALPGVHWHFIGTLQRGSAHHVAELADVVETVVPGSAARRLSRRAADLGRTLPVLIEVDLTGQRTGIAPDRVLEGAEEIVAMPGLALEGLMTLPAIPSVAEDSRPSFRRLRDLLGELAERHPQARELSMGMSLDYEVAVEEGATMVRIGTALFGARPPLDHGRT
ncbi:MAG TPA: YggS family pyridoxal phosphate-dependent enzyme [Actinomycetota bacterium]|nr:YggS family pyridoxal phosphate-dependent enzyme [Actinomycetota bacterium]